MMNFFYVVEIFSMQSKSSPQILSKKNSITKWVYWKVDIYVLFQPLKLFIVILTPSRLNSLNHLYSQLNFHKKVHLFTPHNGPGTILSTKRRVYMCVYVFKLMNVSLFFYNAGITPVLCLLYCNVCINGSFGLPHVWFEYKFTNNLKSSNRKDELKSGHLCHSSKSASQICANGNTCC